MSEKSKKKSAGEELNVQQLLDALVHKLWLIVVISVLCAAIAFVGTLYLITPLYQSSAMFYVNNSNFSMDGASLSISSGDITAAKSLVDSYIVILQSRGTLERVIQYADSDLSYEQLRGMISASSVNATEIFEVVVTSDDPVEAQRLAASIAQILPKRIEGIIQNTFPEVVDEPIVPEDPSSPSVAKNTILGFLIGLILSIGYVVLKLLFDVTIRSEEGVTQITNHPILAAVPNMDAPSKGKYYASDRKNKKTRRPAVVTDSNQNLLGEDMGFAASEAYKLLRTKLQFSFTDGKRSHVIGLSSAMAGEGKSLTAVNLAYSLSQLNKRVILVDCDMRRPTLAEKLNIRKKPGLSSCLTGQIQLQELIQNCGIRGAEESFHVIAAGQNPPNPIELLSSGRMEQVIEALKANYDYVVLDLPPVGEVSDALAVAGLLDGVLIVVRQDYCSSPALSNCIGQFEFIQSKILGIVYNCASENHGGYGYKKYSYRRYGYGRAYKYAGAYAAQRSKEKPGQDLPSPVDEQPQ